ncbi:MAG: dihydropteroate synthase [Solirubrobacteraceae bacterium]
MPAPMYALMGILNVTPDSFSDGGRYLDSAAAIEHGVEMVREGAAIIDVGGESTRPGAEPVAAEEQMRRVLPVIEGLAQRLSGTEISIDTADATVAAAALNAGASIVNDVTALRGDPEMARVVAQTGAHCCLMHMLGEPRTMQREPRYRDVVSEVKFFLEERIAYAISAGIAEQKLLLDPGIGFGKTVAHNLELLRRLSEIAALGRPLVIGTSRKSFLGRLAANVAGQKQPLEVSQRLPGTIATNVLALERGATVFRVHDVAPVRDALAVAAATLGREWTSTSMNPQRTT